MGTAYLCRVQLFDGRAAKRQREILRCAPFAEPLRAGRMTDEIRINRGKERAQLA